MAIDQLGDLLAITDGIICQQVNCKGVMGSGLAKSIRSQYPIVYDSYRSAFLNNELMLGYVHYVTIGDLVVANLCGQYGYGRTGVYTNYGALRHCLMNVQATANAINKQIYLPYLMSCGLAGGDWMTVRTLIEHHTPNAIILKHT